MKACVRLEFSLGGGGWRAPQQMLRTHRSLEANCATLWWRWLVLFVDRRKPKHSGKTCHSATLSTTNATWTDPGPNPGLRGERPATNSLSHGTAGIGVTAPCISNFGIVVNFISRPLYPRDKIPLYPLNRTLCGPPEPVWTAWKRNVFVVSARNWVTFPRSSSPYLSHNIYYPISDPFVYF
jgi:hypothetical protein